jgi:hypothetical protein
VLISVFVKGVVMFKRIVATSFALIILCVGIASAQTPFIAVYFDHAWQVAGNPPAPAGDPCPGLNVLDSLYIALVNANAFVSGVEFAVNYPPEVLFLADFDKQPVNVGTTATGFSQGWALPPNGFSAVYVCGVQFLWQCNGCSVFNSPIVVVQHPDSGFLGYTDFPAYAPIPAVGMTSLICATIPVEETTWGQVKALYVE